MNKNTRLAVSILFPLPASPVVKLPVLQSRGNRNRISTCPDNKTTPLDKDTFKSPKTPVTGKDLMSHKPCIG